MKPRPTWLMAALAAGAITLAMPEVSRGGAVTTETFTVLSGPLTLTSCETSLTYRVDPPDTYVQTRTAAISSAYANAQTVQTTGIADYAYVYVKPEGGDKVGAKLRFAYQQFDVDLTAYPASAGYTKAWLGWTVSYSPGCQLSQPEGLMSSAALPPFRLPLVPGVRQTTDVIRLEPSFPPFTGLAGDNGYGGYGCYMTPPTYGYFVPTVYVQRVTGELQPRTTNAPGASSWATVGDPINTLNGNVSIDETDIVIPAAGLPLAFRRVYASVTDGAGSLGPGWSHTYDWRIGETNTVFQNATNRWLVLQAGENSHWRALAVTNGGHGTFQGLQWDYSVSTAGAYTVALPGGVACVFDTNGFLDRMEAPLGNRLNLTYTNFGAERLLARVQHTDGRSLVFSYQSNRLTRVDSPSTNLWVAYGYNAAGDLTNVVRHAGADSYQIRYACDPATHTVTQRIDAVGGARLWEYQGLRGIRSTVGTGCWYETSVDYGSNGLPCTSVRFDRGDTSTLYRFDYDPAVLSLDAIYGPITNGNPEWLGTEFEHDEYGSFTRIDRRNTWPSGGQWSRTLMRYDGHQRMTNWSFGYMAEPSDVWRFAWNTNWSTLAAVEDPEGNRVEYTYSGGLPTAEKVWLSATQSLDTCYGYTTNGLLDSVTNANGHWIRYSYDAYGNPTSVVPQAGPAFALSWDALGNLEQIRLPSSQYDTNTPPQMVPRVIAFDPDELGRVRSVTWPDSTSEAFAYDPLGNLTNHTDAAGRATRYEWLPTRKLAAVTRTLTGATNQEAAIRFQYDRQFNSVAVRDELDRLVETYTLDLQDRPVAVSNIEGRTMAIAYGLDQYVTSITRFDGTAVSFSHDGTGRLSRAAYPGITNDYAYLRNGLLRTAAAAGGVISNAYDGAGRLTETRNPVPNGTVSYGYLPAGQVASVITVAGTNTYAFDAAERVTTIGSAMGGVSNSYNANNGLVALTRYANGVTATYSYDALDRLTGIVWRDGSNEVLRSFAYTYTAAGLIAYVTRETGERWDYTYDSLDRLTREKHVNPAGEAVSDERYEYDLAGNRTRKTIMSGTSALITANYTLGTGNRLAAWSVAETDLVGQIDVAGSSTEPIGTDPRFGELWVGLGASSGQVTNKFTPWVSGTNFYAFGLLVGLGSQKVVAAIRDAAGNMGYATNSVFLAVVTNGSYAYSDAGCVTNVRYSGKDYSSTLSLAWDGQYRLTSASTNGVLAESCTYDAFGRRISITSGGATTYLVYDGPHVIAEVNLTGGLTRSYLYGPGIDNVIAMTVHAAGSTSTYWYVKDHLGSVVALTDKDGRVAESYRYDAWGRVSVYDAVGAPLAESAVGNRILWQGREYSWKTGLYYFRARWYEPVTGRWLSNDPIGISGGLNQYVFCGNNPVSFRDPFGLCEGNTGPAFWGGYALSQSANVRNQYVTAVSGIPNDANALRDALKFYYRLQTPEPIRSGLDAEYPISGARPGSVGRANVANPQATALARNMGRIGNGLIGVGAAAEAYNIATAPKGQRLQTVAGASGRTLGGLGGGIAGAESGAALGASGGPYGAAAGAIVGGLIGAFGGGAAGGATAEQIYLYTTPADGRF